MGKNLYNTGILIKSLLYRMHFLPERNIWKKLYIYFNRKIMKTTKNVGLIGYGHLGKALTKQIKDKTNIDVNVSEGKECNYETASNADVLILTVRPHQVAEVMREIRGALKENAIIISFAAAVPKAHIRQEVSSIVIRAMTDIEFEQIIAESHKDTDSILDAISANRLIQTTEEEKIDAFTVLIGCLPGVAAWQFANNTNDEWNWLAKYIQFIENEIGVSKSVSKEICIDVWKNGSFTKKVKSVATKDGVTEALIEALEENSEISFAELLTKGMNRIDKIQRGLLKKIE